MTAFPLAASIAVPGSHWDGRLAVDLMAACGTPWRAVFSGVAEPVDLPLGGHALFLRGDNGLTAYYAHGAPGRASGRVSEGQEIGSVSDSGNAAGKGCHLHFAVGRQIDGGGAGDIAPWDFLSGAPVGVPSLLAIGDGSPYLGPLLLLVGAVVLLDWLE